MSREPRKGLPLIPKVPPSLELPWASSKRGSRDLGLGGLYFVLITVNVSSLEEKHPVACFLLSNSGILWEMVRVQKFSLGGSVNLSFNPPCKAVHPVVTRDACALGKAWGAGEEECGPVP